MSISPSSESYQLLFEHIFFSDDITLGAHYASTMLMMDMFPPFQSFHAAACPCLPVPSDATGMTLVAGFSRAFCLTPEARRWKPWRNQAAVLKPLQETGDGCEKCYRLQLQCRFHAQCQWVPFWDAQQRWVPGCRWTPISSTAAPSYC